MAQLNVRRLYAATEPLLKQDLDAFIDDIETFVNVTRLGNDNIQDASIDASTKVIDNTFAGEKLENSAVTTAKINDSAVTTAKINDSAVTTAKINDSAVTTAKINDSAVTTAKIADGAVTFPKLVEGYTVSSAATYTDNVNGQFYRTKAADLTITLTANDAYVIIESNGGYLLASITATNSGAAATSGNNYYILLSQKTSGATTATWILRASLSDYQRINNGAYNWYNTFAISPFRIILPSPGIGTYVFGVFTAGSGTGYTSTTSEAKFTIRSLIK